MRPSPFAFAGIVGLLGGAVVLSPLNAAPAAAADTDVLVNEVITNDPVLPDSIELYNSGTEAVDLSGWVIKDDDDSRTDALPAGTILEPGAYLVLAKDAGFSFGLGNGDAARLYDEAGTLISEYVFPSHSAPSWSRCPNGAVDGEWIQAVEVTLGAENNCEIPVEPGNLVLNEADSGPADWIEFANLGGESVDMSGYIITDNAPTDVTHQYVVPEGTVVEPGAFFVFDALPFGLGGADGVYVFAPGTTDFSFGNALMSTTWTEHAAVDGDEAGYANSRCTFGAEEFWAVAPVTPGAANDCPSPVVINEVESNGDATDWVEIVNASTEPVDISGWTVMDNDPLGHAADVTPVPAGTVLQPGEYFVFDQNTHFAFGLGGGDVATVRDATGATVTEYAWTEHALVTYGRCPDTTGEMVDQTVSTKGAANACGDVVEEPTDPAPVVDTIPWPGSPDVTVLDPEGMFLEDSSGLDYQADGNILWGVDNDSATIFKMNVAEDGSVTLAEGWENGRNATFAKDAGNPDAAGPDAEGITVGGDGMLYLAIERDNSDKGTNMNMIMQVDPNTDGTGSIPSSMEWNVTASLPDVAANTGLEAIEWIPDSALAGQLWDDAAGAPYDPANFEGKMDGLFVVALENNGDLYAFALWADGTHVLVGTIDPMLGGVMALDYDSALDKIWAVCDNGCEGTAALIDLNGTATPDIQHVTAPGGMDTTLNNEGFATSPVCVNDERFVWWFADGEVTSALRQGSLPCAAPVEEPTTEEPTTEVPTTEEPTTDAPVTEAPTTDVPTTDVPTTDAGGTDAPAAGAPTTGGAAPLPSTGANVMGLLWLAGAAVLVGGSLVAVRSRES